MRTLLIATAICGLLLAPVAVEFARYRRETAAVNQIVGFVLRDSNLYGSGSDRSFDSPLRRVVDFRSGISLTVIRRSEWLGLAHSVIEIGLRGHVTMGQIEVMADLPSLTSLHINDATLDLRDLKALSRLSALRSIDLSGCQLPDGALQPLAQLRKLEELQLHNTGVTDSAIVELQELLPGLDVLDD